MKTCFIGHRNIYDPSVRDNLKKVVMNQIAKGCKKFSMGTHGEFDRMALGVCKELKRTYIDIEIEVVITSLNSIKKQLVFDDCFGKEYEEPYKDVNTVMYDIEDTYFKRQITESNHQMIDDCDTLICYVDKKKWRSGAKLALNYAKRKGLEIINLFDEKDNPTYGMTKEEKENYYKNLLENLKNNKKTDR